MRTVIRRANRSWGYDFLVGMILGFLGGMLRPAREASGAPAEPPAPRPIEVPIATADEEPVWLPVSFPDAPGGRQVLHVTPTRAAVRIGASGGAP